MSRNANHCQSKVTTAQCGALGGQDLSDMGLTNGSLLRTVSWLCLDPGIRSFLYVWSRECLYPLSSALSNGRMRTVHTDLSPSGVDSVVIPSSSELIYSIFSVNIILALLFSWSLSLQWWLSNAFFLELTFWSIRFLLLTHFSCLVLLPFRVLVLSFLRLVNITFAAFSASEISTGLGEAWVPRTTLSITVLLSGWSSETFRSNSMPSSLSSL